MGVFVLYLYLRGEEMVKLVFLSRTGCQSWMDVQVRWWRNRFAEGAGRERVEGRVCAHRKQVRRKMSTAIPGEVGDVVLIGAVRLLQLLWVLQVWRGVVCRWGRRRCWQGVRYQRSR